MIERTRRVTKFTTPPELHSIPATLATPDSIAQIDRIKADNNTQLNTVIPKTIEDILLLIDTIPEISIIKWIYLDKQMINFAMLTSPPKRGYGGLTVTVIKFEELISKLPERITLEYVGKLKK